MGVKIVNRGQAGRDRVEGHRGPYTTHSQRPQRLHKHRVEPAVDKTALRLQLLANGYVPIPIEHKEKPFYGWPLLMPTPDLIRQWERSLFEGTALLLRGDLLVVDLDINDPVIDEIAEKFFAYLNIPSPPTRLGLGLKEAWFFREAEPVKRWASREWFKPGDPDTPHRVEIFGTLTKGRYFGVYGPHTLNPDGTVRIAYRWVEGIGLYDIPRADLPVLTKQQIARLVDITDEVLKAKDWTFDERSAHGETGGDTVYNLTDDMHFDLETGDRVPLSVLQAMAENDRDLDIRCSTTFLGVPSRNSRCRIHSNHDNRLTIYDNATAILHRPVEDEPHPVEEMESVIARLAALPQYAEPPDPPPTPFDDLPQPCKGDSHDTAFAKMLKSYAFLKGGTAGSIYMGADSVTQTMSMAALRDLMRPYAEMRRTETPTGRPTRKLFNPADAWLAHADRIDVDGLVSAPGKSTPTFIEDGLVFINSYRPPLHDPTGGSADVAWRFIDHLFPIPKERRYFIQLLGNKMRHPETPGPSVISVADGVFGSGRTTLGQIIERLLGPRYVKELEFRTLSGETGQSQYNEWAATGIFILVDESSETQNSQYKQRRNAYEFLKRHCDPRPVKRQITIKGKNNYQATTCATFFIATNHIDAISIPENDRRFAVLSNGAPLPADLAEEINTWMESPANIAAFYHDLCAVDLAGYSPYAEPIKTTAKTRMATETQTDTDQAVALALADLKTAVITVPVLTRLAETAAKDHSLVLFGVTQSEREGSVKRAAKRSLHAMYTATGERTRVLISGTRQLAYALSAKDVEYYKMVDTAFITRDVKKNLGDVKSAEDKLGKMYGMNRED